jgi:hypothetical protein
MESYYALYAQQAQTSTMIADIITDMITGIGVYRWAELKIVEE